ncbi:hypothetical protein HHI36_003332 [Cryptolaemus montrouzieri]|uniref:Uncharacterized protein n=1 Tax=Cryptolaemus montrouzieri TaxID=559131 RepID=A0ABD2PDT3_9CUCU
MVKPSSINANIVNTKLIKNGMLINCKNTVSLGKLKDDSNHRLSSNFEVKEPRKFNPRIIFYGLDPEEVESNELIPDIIRHNQLERFSSDIKLITTFKYRKSCIIVIEYKTEAFKVIVEKGYLWVSWGNCLLLSILAYQNVSNVGSMAI